MKKLLVLLVLSVLFLSSTYGLEFTLNRGSFTKGGTLTIEGSAESVVTIEARQGEKEIFTRRAEIDEDNFFSYSREIDFSHPKGIWELTVSDSENSISRKITVNPSRESEYLVVKFLSPTPTNYFRTNSFDLVVELTDAGKEVKDASVRFWDIGGKLERLTNNLDGTYSTNYNIPFDSRTGEWVLKVVAVARSAEGELSGGENSLDLTIEPSPISIEVLEPRAKEYEVGEKIPLAIKLSYANGLAVADANVYAVVNFEVVTLTAMGGGTFATEYSVREPKDELITIEFNASDSAENTGNKTISLKPLGYLWWLVRENAIYYIFPLIFLMYILYLSAKELRVFAKRSNLKGRRLQLVNLKKRLHEDFYKRSIISEKAFNRKNAELNADLDKIEEELKTVKEE